MLEIKVFTTDHALVDDINSSGIGNVKAEFRPTMAYDTAEHLVEVVITVIAPTALALLKDWLVGRWTAKVPKQLQIQNKVVTNAESIVVIVQNINLPDDRKVDAKSD